MSQVPFVFLVFGFLLPDKIANIHNLKNEKFTLILWFRDFSPHMAGSKPETSWQRGVNNEGAWETEQGNKLQRKRPGMRHTPQGHAGKSQWDTPRSGLTNLPRS